MKKPNKNTVFDFNVVYHSNEVTIEEIKNALIGCALKHNFDIGIEAVETYEIPEV